MTAPPEAIDAAVETAGPPLQLIAPVTGVDHPINPLALQAFQERLGHEFADARVLGRALTHRSWCAEHAAFASNERLEFLGDAVLGLVVTDDIYHRFPDAEEGQLSRVRASVVCAPALAEMARELGMGEVLLLGKGEASSGGRDRSSILADAMEAIIGAVYLDGGSEPAGELVRRLIAPRLDDATPQDHKSRLHELVAREHTGAIRYVLTEDGPEHDKTFRAVVLVDDAPAGAGVGRSKKSAEQAAAREALSRLDPLDRLDPTRGAPSAREEPDG